MITKIYYSDTTLEISLQHSVFIVVNSVLLVVNWKINPNIKLIYCNTHTHSFDTHIFLSGFFYNWHSPIAGHHWRRDVDSNSFLIFPPTSQTITAENSPLRIASDCTHRRVQVTNNKVTWSKRWQVGNLIVRIMDIEINEGIFLIRLNTGRHWQTQRFIWPITFHIYVDSLMLPLLSEFQPKI